ncbi:unnamed protein product, partial [Meganyctiphanes norvegica]
HKQGKMATPSPRKFTEKIAILHQKEVEGTSDFDQIMAEVKNITARGRPVQPQEYHHHGHQHPGPPQQQHHAPQPMPPHLLGSKSPQTGSLPDFTINLQQRSSRPEQNNQHHWIK